jgi:zinc protease
LVAMRIPPCGSPTWFAASVAAAVLGMRKGSRVYRRLVRETQVASSASAWTFDLTKGADLLVVDATANAEVSADTLVAAVHEELDRLSMEGVADAEVTRALALIETDFVLALQSAEDRADTLSRFATYFGDPTLVNTQADRYRAVTSAAVSAFVREWCGASNRATLVYVPRRGAVEVAA